MKTENMATQLHFLYAEDFSISYTKGRVPVFVKEKVKDGDLLVPSGHNDGTAISRTARSDKRIIGTAWETSDKEERRTIEAACALQHYGPVTKKTWITWKNFTLIVSVLFVLISVFTRRFASKTDHS